MLVNRDEWLEQRIHRAGQSLLQALNDAQRREAWQRYVRLVNARSTQRVKAMELAKGLVQ